MGKDSTLAPGYHIYTGRTEKLYHKEQETDDSWQPSIGAVLKLLLSVRIAGTLWSVLRDADETTNHWEPLHLMLYHQIFPSWKQFPFEPLADIQCRILNVLVHKLAYCYSNFLDQSQIAVFTLVRLTFALACIGSEYYAFRVISERINISAGRYFLIFSIFSYGMFHASVTFSLHTVSMICSFFFLGGILDDKRWLCWVTWIISFTLGSWPTFCFFGLTIFASWVWQRSLHKKWIGKQLFALAAIASSIVLYSCSHAYLPIYLRTLYPFQATHEYLSTVKVSVRPPTTTFYFIQDLISNWNVAALLALVGPYLGCITCWKFQKHRDIWKTWNDPSPIFFLTINSSYWLSMFVLLGQHESFLFPLYPNISLFAAIACDSIPRLWHKKEDDPVVEKGRQPPTDPFLNWPRNQAHSFIYVLVGFYIICSLVRINTVYQSYGSELDIYKGFTEELNAHEDLSRFNSPITLCHSKTSKRFTSSLFIPLDLYDAVHEYRVVGIKMIEADHIGILSESKKQSHSLLDSCDYVVDIDKHSFAIGADETSSQWKPILSLPYIDTDRTGTTSSLFSMPFFSKYFNLIHYTTITLYRRVVS